MHCWDNRNLPNGIMHNDNVSDTNQSGVKDIVSIIKVGPGSIWATIPNSATRPWRKGWSAGNLIGANEAVKVEIN